MNRLTFIMNICVVYACLATPLLLHAQDQQRGTITDSKGNPLIFVTVRYMQSKIGCYTDSTGYFLLPNFNGDTLFVSALGFENLKITPSTKHQNIVLKEKYEELPTAIVFPRRKTKWKTEFGFYNKLDNVFYSFPNFHEEAVFIRNESQVSGAYIDAIKFRLDKFKNSDYTLIIRIYSLDSASGLPGKDLLLSDNLLYPSDLHKTNYFDVKDKNIRLPPNGVFISFRWIVPNHLSKDHSLSPYLIYNTKVDRSYGFANNNNGKGWRYYKEKNTTLGAGYAVPSVSIIVSY